MEKDEKSILILCTGYHYGTDAAFGYHVSKVLEKMKLPKNVQMMEVGEFACLIPNDIEVHDKLIVIDIFPTGDKPGTIVRLAPDDVPIPWDDATDVARYHLLETLQQLYLLGKCPETIFIGVVPKDVKTIGTELTPEIEKRIPEVIDLIMKEISYEGMPEVDSSQ